MNNFAIASANKVTYESHSVDGSSDMIIAGVYGFKNLQEYVNGNDVNDEFDTYLCTKAKNCTPEPGPTPDPQP